MADLIQVAVPGGTARDHFSATLDRAGQDKERVVLTRRGKPYAALVPIEDLELLEAIEDRLDAEELKRAKEAFERSGEPAIPLDDVLRELAMEPYQRDDATGGGSKA